MPQFTTNQDYYYVDDSDSIQSSADGEWQQFRLNNYASRESLPSPERNETMPTRTSTSDREPGHGELYIAPEVEYPVAQAPEPTMTRAGIGGTDWREEVNSSMYQTEQPVRGDAIIGTDGTVGIEIRPTQNGGLHEERVADWYRELLEDGQRAGYPHEPTGKMTNSYSTAGLHLHLSPLEASKAETLYEWSQEDWMWAFACSSIVTEGAEATANVFRNNYCRFNGFNYGRYSAVHDAPGPGHYEWRLPEPMTADHFDLVVTFLYKLHHEGTTEAKEYAMDLVESRDERLTAVQRFDAGNVAELLSEPNVTAHRTPVADSESFFRAVRGDASVPYIYTVWDHDEDQPYYTFRSHTGSGDESYDVDGYDVTVSSGTVLRADELVHASPDEVSLVNEAMEQRLEAQTADLTTSDATQLLMP
jgi:hypothetical protein